MMRKSKTQDFQLDFLPTQQKQEYKSSYRQSKQELQLNLQDDIVRQSRLSDVFRDLDQQLSNLGQLSFDDTDQNKNQTKNTKKQQELILQDRIQKLLDQNTRLNKVIQQFKEKDRQKSSQIQQLKIVIQRLSQLLQSASSSSENPIQVDDQSLDQQRQIYMMQREIQSYKKRVSQFQEDLNNHLQKQLAIERISDSRKNQIDILKQEIKGLKQTLLSLKGEMHHLNLIIANKKNLLLSIQTEFKPYKEVRQDQLAQNVNSLLSQLKTLRYSLQKKDQAMDMIEDIIKSNRLSTKQTVGY